MHKIFLSFYKRKDSENMVWVLVGIGAKQWKNKKGFPPDFGSKQAKRKKGVRHFFAPGRPIQGQNHEDNSRSCP